jgi:lipopolysaccharide transport system permease protein
MNYAWRSYEVEPEGNQLRVDLTIANRSRETWTVGNFAVGWQLFDPAAGRFLAHGDWVAPQIPVVPGEVVRLSLRIPFAPEPGSYDVYVSPLDPGGEWGYKAGGKFLRIDAVVEGRSVRVRASEIATRRSVRWRRLRRVAPVLLWEPFGSLWRHRKLIGSLTRRDVLSRYRGSFAGALWTLLNPLLLMATYFFVFGVVLRTRFGNDTSGAGYVLYFLAGMLPWLAVSEAAGRSPNVIVEYRSFVKKLVFPVETLSAVQVLSGVVTEVMGMAIFVVGLWAGRGRVPASVVWLPALLAVQVLFTLGLCWFLAALGAFLRDLGQIIGFLLTLWFFLTPICYPESGVPKAAKAILGKNPMLFLVRAYRAVFLEGQGPQAHAFAMFTVLAAALFLLGHAWFYKLRKNFADVI